MNILLIDDDQDSRSCVAEFLSQLGHYVVECDNGHDGLGIFKGSQFHMVLSDIKMPRMSGIDLLQKLSALPNRADFDVVLFTGHGDMNTAIEALRAGAYDYLLKPISVEELAVLTDRIAERQVLLRENRILTEKFEDEVRAATEETRQELSRLKKVLCQSVGLGNIGVFSGTMKNIYQQADKLHADRSIPVLIQGETGTGKEIIARYIHFAKGDVTFPFVDINCAAITPGIFESEIFGYDPGAFTGGLPRGQKGKLDIARGGTIFLDEIGEIPGDLQAKLLRVIQEREYYRVSGLKKIQADVRLICATNLDLEQKISEGTFRKDLYYRLNVGRIFLPPLRERPEEIVPLAEMFLEGFAREKGRGFHSISKEAAGILKSYQWPGNVRELKNAIEWVVLMWDDTRLEPSHLSILQMDRDAGLPLKNTGAGAINHKNFTLPPGGLPLEEFTDRIIQKALEMNRGVKTETAKYLGISRRSLYCHLSRMASGERKS